MTTLRPLSDDSIITVDIQYPISGHTLGCPREFPGRVTAHLKFPITVAIHQKVAGLYLAGTPVDFADAATQHAIATAVTTALATIHGPAKPIPGAPPLM